MRSLSSVLLLVSALLGSSQAWQLKDFLGLRSPSKSRELQEGVFSLCAAPVNGRKPHLLAVLDRRGNVVQRWVPLEDERFLANVNFDEGTLNLFGNLVPLGDTDLENVLTVDLTYSLPVEYTQCYCASDIFLQEGEGPFPLDPNYGKIQRQCNLKNYESRPDEAEDLLFCPFCQDNLCKKAANLDLLGLPEPIYRDWTFYQDVDGEFGGPGLELLREAIEKGFKKFNIDENIDECSPDITNQPLPQLHCSDYNEPLEGLGFGVNGKNLKCGFSTWFNCAEDLPALGGDDVNVKVADINLELIPCPPEPDTPVPTPVITAPPSPAPTESPTPCPRKPCKKIEVCVPCKYFPDDETCGEDGDWLAW